LLTLSGQVGRKEDGALPEDPVEQLDAAPENLIRNAAKCWTSGCKVTSPV
jgi:hypothetical protein